MVPRIHRERARARIRIRSSPFDKLRATLSYVEGSLLAARCSLLV